MIKLENVSFAYPQDTVLDRISLDIKQGDYMVLLGTNGSGKSTLVKLIVGLLNPDSGRIIRDTQKVAYVPQQGLESIQFPVSVEEMLCFRLPKKEAKNAPIDEVLELVGLSDYRKRLIKDLSGGQRQRVLIARELLIKPDVMVLDEPSTGLDQDSMTVLYSILDKLNKEQQLTVVLVTHHIEDHECDGKRILEVSQHTLKEHNHV